MHEPLKFPEEPQILGENEESIRFVNTRFGVYTLTQKEEKLHLSFHYAEAVAGKMPDGGVERVELVFPFEYLVEDDYIDIALYQANKLINEHYKSQTFSLVMDNFTGFDKQPNAKDELAKELFAFAEIIRAFVIEDLKDEALPALRILFTSLLGKLTKHDPNDPRIKSLTRLFSLTHR